MTGQCDRHQIEVVCKQRNFVMATLVGTSGSIVTTGDFLTGLGQPLDASYEAKPRCQEDR